MIDQFIVKNLTLNTVLDKINESGMESLGKSDYDVLKNVK